VVSDSNKKDILKGYILCHCQLTPELVRFFHRIKGIIGFSNHQRGDKKLPDFISEEAVKNFLTKLREKKESKLSSYEEVNLNIGDLVKITKGSFINQEGRITHLDKKKQKVKIVIEPSG
jgi:transcription antitermination factor NusG